jgi:phage anti-repressor protein
MSVDIVNLIESNPITKFTGNYQSKLIEKVKNSFTAYEQQIFLASFYCYLKYDYKNDFVIDLDNVWKWLGFQQKYHAKYLLEKQFTNNADYKIFAPEASEAKKNVRGGHNKEIIMLNIDTFKKFCLKAGTKKADEIHEYFIKLEEILQEVLFEESNELKQQLQQLENTKNKELEEKLIKQKELDNEIFLLKEYANSGPLVYIIKVKTFKNGEYIIKIGHSEKGVLNRYNEHKTNYGECLLLNCFAVDKSKDFESFIHNHNLIHPNKYKTLKGHEKENELFLVGKNLTYKILLKIIQDNIDNYKYKINELLLENQLLKEKINSNQPIIQSNSTNEITELKQLIISLSCEMSELKKTNQLILSKLNEKETKLVNGFNQQIPNLGPRLQKINPENLQLVKVYESVTELMNEDKNIKRPSIMKAIQENTIYCGFRWLLVERNLDPNIIHSINPTKQTKVQSLGYIAKLNSEKTEITNVYLDRKTAAHFNGYESSSALDNPVKNYTLTKGFYYRLYDDCDETLREAFEEKNGEPLLYKNGVGQFDTENVLIKAFACKYDCIKSLSISDKTLAKALKNNISYNGFYYKELDSKLYY